MTVGWKFHFWWIINALYRKAGWMPVSGNQSIETPSSAKELFLQNISLQRNAVLHWTELKSWIQDVHWHPLIYVAYISIQKVVFLVAKELHLHFKATTLPVFESNRRLVYLVLWGLYQSINKTAFCTVFSCVIYDLNRLYSVWTVWTEFEWQERINHVTFSQ